MEIRVQWSNLERNQRYKFILFKPLSMYAEKIYGTQHYYEFPAKFDFKHNSAFTLVVPKDPFDRAIARFPTSKRMEGYESDIRITMYRKINGRMDVESWEKV
jgi:hypothetical protein